MIKGDWPPECEALCKAAENMQAAINELWKAQNLEELTITDEPMTEEEARENHNDCWKTLTEAIYYMRKRMERPMVQEKAEPSNFIATIFIADGKMTGTTAEYPLPTGTYYLYDTQISTGLRSAAEKLPTWDDCNAALARGDELNPLEKFIYEHETMDAGQFRQELKGLISFVRTADNNLRAIAMHAAVFLKGCSERPDADGEFKLASKKILDDLYKALEQK